MKFPDNLHKKLTNRKIDNSFRELNDQHQLIDFSSNDYLGFSKNKTIYRKVNEDLENLEPLNGSTGSRLISGNHLLHEEVEMELANFFKVSAALIFNSGYDANVGLMSSVAQHNDIVLYDELCHASIRDGIRLSHAKAYSFKHNDLKDLEKKFNNTGNEKGNIYVIVESIYSMDGDQAPLIQLSNFCEENKIYFIVDEAHSTGIFGDFGNGLVIKQGLEEKVFARIHTFGKAMGCHGGVIVGSFELKTFLINYARPFIYTTAMPLHNVLTIKYSLKELLVTQERIMLNDNIKIFRNAIEEYSFENIFVKSESPIQSCIIPNNIKVKELAQKLRAQRFNIKAILSPTVPIGKERLRFCIHSYNSKEQIQEIFKLLSTFV